MRDKILLQCFVLSEASAEMANYLTDDYIALLVNTSVFLALCDLAAHYRDISLYEREIHFI